MPTNREFRIIKESTEKPRILIGERKWVVNIFIVLDGC